MVGIVGSPVSGSMSGISSTFESDASPSARLGNGARMRVSGAPYFDVP